MDASKVDSRFKREVTSKRVSDALKSFPLASLLSGSLLLLELPLLNMAKPAAAIKLPVMEVICNILKL